MSTLMRTPSINLLLVLAALHQLGASPCGCLEHHGWSQWLRQTLSASCVAVHGEDEECVVESMDCDHASRDAALLTARVAAPLRGVFSDTALNRVAEVVDLLREATRRYATPLFGESAPPVRALLQVFRL